MKNKSFSILALLCLSLAGIFPLSIRAQIITTYAGTGSGGYGGDGAAAQSAKLYFPNQMAIDNAGNMYICDRVNNRIRKINTSGIISTYAGTGVGADGGDGGPATAANVQTPSGVVLDASGNLYITECEGNRVRKVTPAGIITTIAGTGAGGHTGDGGTATAATLNGPWTSVVDPAGNLYIADGFYNNCIRKITPSGIISTIAGGGSSLGDGGPATASQLANPSGLALDTAGNLYIADYGNNRIRKINAAGIITTVAGTGTAAFSGDGGPATAAELWGPDYLVVASDGSIFFSDEQNSRVRKINPAGIVSTIAGNGAVGYSGDKGPATACEFYDPTGLIFDKYGDLYVADYINNKVRVITNVLTLCPGTTDTLHTLLTGGRWVSANTALATVGSSTGIASGVSTGNVNAYYVVNGDTVYAPLYVDTLPSVSAITGTDSVCPGHSVTLSDAVPGGSWGSDNVTLASVSGSGIIVGVAPGYDTITYRVTDRSGCSNTARFVVKVRSSTICTEDEPVIQQRLDAIVIYPNPSSGIFTIEIPSTNDKTYLTVYDLCGRTVDSREIAPNADKALLNLAGIPRGTYLLQMQNAIGSLVRKIILE